jgi:hypothetical protein
MKNIFKSLFVIMFLFLISFSVGIQKETFIDAEASSNPYILGSVDTNCAEENCSSYTFCTSWEDGDTAPLELNTGGAFVWDNEVGSVTHGVGTFETCTDPNAIFINSEPEHVTEGGSLDYTQGTMRACFDITDDTGVPEAQSNWFGEFKDEVNGTLMQLRYLDWGGGTARVSTRVKDNGVLEGSTEYYSFNDDSSLPFCIEVVYDITGGAAKWRLWTVNKTTGVCTKVVPAAGDWDEYDITDISGYEIDEFSVGSADSAGAMVYEIDKVIFYNGVGDIGCPTFN